MKLEIKHIAPYLLYNLQCKAMCECDTTFEMQGVSDITWIDLHEKDRSVNEQFDIEDVFPILHPMSDMTKEININGKNIIPIIELAKLNEVDSDEIDADDESSEIKEGDTYCWFDYYIDSWDTTCRFYYDFNSKVFQYGTLDPNTHKPMRKGLELFDMLYKWHFDVFGLIEQGLAVDINTL